jgi:hypothetical protein
MTGARTSDENPVLSCDCQGDSPDWPICDDFCDNDQGKCMNCGHRGSCHEPLK